MTAKSEGDLQEEQKQREDKTDCGGSSGNYRGELTAHQKDVRRSPISETKENGEEELRCFLTRTEATTIAYTLSSTLWRRKRVLVGSEPDHQLRNGDRRLRKCWTSWRMNTLTGLLQKLADGGGNKGWNTCTFYMTERGIFATVLCSAEEINPQFTIRNYQQRAARGVRLL